MNQKITHISTKILKQRKVIIPNGKIYTAYLDIQIYFKLHSKYVIKYNRKL